MDLETCTQVFQQYRDSRLLQKTKEVMERSKKIGRMRTGTSSFLERTLYVPAFCVSRPVYEQRHAVPEEYGQQGDPI